MDYLQFLSWACIVFTVGMFSTGLPDMKKMYASKSADNVQFLPFLTTCLNNFSWLYYGVMRRDETVVLVNTIGALLQILYIVVYFYFTKQKRLVMSQTAAAGAMLASGWLYFNAFLPEGDIRLSHLGLTCSVFTVSMYLSPLTDLVEIVSTGNVECLSFPLTVATFFTSTSWCLYGLQLNDFYIMIPNIPGVLTSLLRFYLFWKFASANRSSPSYKSLHI